MTIHKMNRVSGLMNIKLFIRINNQIEFIKEEFRVGDEIIIGNNAAGIIASIIGINNDLVNYSYTVDNKNVISLLRISHLTPRYSIFKRNDKPTPQDIQNKQLSIRHLDDYLTELKTTPVQLSDVTLSFIGEDFREGLEKDLAGRKQILF